MNELALLQNYLIVGALLFGLGLIGFLVRRNMIVMFLCVEMMLQGVSLSLAAWGRYHQDWGGQMLVLFIITVAACEAGVALALILAVFRLSGSLDVAVWQGVREEGQAAFVDQEIPEERHPDRVWPSLAPAGVAPRAEDQEEPLHRGRV